jgi:hypothetical protein
MSEDPAKTAEHVATRLADHGHHAHAHSMRRALTLGAERTVLLALREACQTVLSAVEAFDPETSAMIEELRLSIDRRLAGPPSD